MAASDIRDRDIKKFARSMEKNGWRFELGKGGHFRVFDPAGDYAGPLSGSAGTPRWELAQLKSMERKWARR